MKRETVLNIASFGLLIVLGAFMFLYAGADDSPGGQGLGLLGVILGVVGVVRTLR